MEGGWLYVIDVVGGLCSGNREGCCEWEKCFGGKLYFVDEIWGFVEGWFDDW